MLLSHLRKNAFTIWLRSLFRTVYYEFVFRKQHLKIGFMTSITDATFGNYNYIYDYVVLREVKLGDYSYVAYGTNIFKATIGKFCSIGPDVKCGLGRHPSHTFVSTHPIFYSPIKQSQVTFTNQSYFEEYKEIKIGNDVWIGANAVIVGGVEIGDGAIIAAGSVVTKNVPAYSIVSGVPAAVVRFRFNEEIIRDLSKINWWNFDINYLKNNFKAFHDVDCFIGMHDGVEISNTSHPI